MPKISTKSYLLRAIYEWCNDSGYTPYLAARVDANTRVPIQFVKNDEIILNISFEATSGLKIDEKYINFSTRFGGVSQPILIGIPNVIAIYACESGQGIMFEKSDKTTMIGNDIIIDQVNFLEKIDTIEKPVFSPSASIFTDISQDSSVSNKEKEQKKQKILIKNRKPTLTRIK
jgi:stringent starvation protein B